MKNAVITLIALSLLVGGGYYLIKSGSESGIPTREPTPLPQIKVGFIGPLSEDAALYESIKRGVELAKQDLGADHITLVFEKSKCGGEEAATAINRLIFVDGVQAVVDGVCSEASLVAAPIAKESKIPLVSPSSTGPGLTDAGEYFFRTVPSDALRGAFGAQLVWERKLKTLAVLYGNEEYGVGFNTTLIEEFEKLGGKVVASETFEEGSNNIKSQLTKIKSKKPAAIYLISNSPDSAVAALKQIKESGINAVVVGSEGLKSDEIVSGAGKAAEGMIVTSVSLGTSRFIARHNEVYGIDPGLFAAQGYDALKAIARAVERGAATGETIAAELGSVSFNGASGKIAFDENGDIAGNYEVYVVKDGVFVLEKQHHSAIRNGE